MIIHRTLTTLSRNDSPTMVICRCLDIGQVKVQTEGRPRPLQDWLKKINYAKVQKKDATVEEECPKCGHEKATFTTVQLRSVDEGSTVFYKCMKCSHHWSENN